MYIEYEKFRTGFTFKDIRDMLKMEADKEYKKGKYMFITRHTVLGRWKQIKGLMYDEYIKSNGIDFHGSRIEISEDFLI